MVCPLILYLFSSDIHYNTSCCLLNFEVGVILKVVRDFSKKSSFWMVTQSKDGDSPLCKSLLVPATDCRVGAYGAEQLNSDCCTDIYKVKRSSNC